MLLKFQQFLMRLMAIIESPHILHLAVETAATQTKPTDPGLPTPNFWLVRAGRLLYSIIWLVFSQALPVLVFRTNGATVLRPSVWQAAVKVTPGLTTTTPPA